MNEQFEFNPKEAQIEGLKDALDYVDAIEGLTEEERGKLRNNMEHPGIQFRVLDIKYTSAETDPEAPHRAGILLEALKRDLKALS
jgi:hypothetical protein